MRLGEGVAGQVIREAITINVGDVKLIRAFSHRIHCLLSVHCWSLPFKVEKAIGTISVQSEKMHAFSSKDQNYLMH